ncbi:RNA polymerase sigma factor SigB [Halalkalibacter alkaliphilus]|uniref:RNA polymerase sigma factor n=1 Tax=Halalkalibacter alkaliphilus TaxID=2917993 RepID=A0A9X2CWP2_9BACI|nr:RNA polymerase sigma factor SigB [Halalkalibacter alkaliphilus]MCL7749628.1 RNA polymerase sigma factor SigB [Halalkalibacter alkaliphilus]
MSVESNRHNQNNERVYEWIEHYQHHGDEESQLKLVRHYEALVRSLSRKFSKGREYEEDMFQVGMVGLLAALKRYDPQVGKSFESFAVPTIVGEIKRFIRDKTWSVHVPRRIKELGPKIKSAVEALTAELQRSPLVQELADYLGVTEEEILETMEMGKSYKALSVDRSLEADQEGGEVTLLDLVGNVDSGYDEADQKLVIEKAFSVLEEREKQILICTYFENYSQKETGEKLGMSQMHVSRLQRRALEKLRESIKIEPSEIL